jgi:hypothetical protein
MVNGQRSTLNAQRSTLNGQRSTVNRQLFKTSWQMTDAANEIITTDGRMRLIPYCFG